MESFGQQLKHERERRGITLEDVSSATKIGTRMLRALEEEKFDQLPGGIFNKGFVRAYAQHLGMDEEQAVADYLAATGEKGQPKPAEDSESFPEVQEETAERTAARIPWGGLALVLLLAALGFAVWNTYFNRALPAADSSPESAAGKARAAAPNRSSPRPSNAPAPAAGKPSATVPSVAFTGGFTVLIKAQEDSWVSISVDGKQVMQDTLAARAEKSISAQHEIVIRAGNVGGLEFLFNGQKLPGQGDYGEVKTLTFGAQGLQPQATAPAPAAEAAPPGY